MCFLRLGYDLKPFIKAFQSNKYLFLLKKHVLWKQTTINALSCISSSFLPSIIINGKCVFSVHLLLDSSGGKTILCAQKALERNHSPLI